MRTPPHLPARTIRDTRDTDTVRPRRHPYGLHEVPVQSAPLGTLDLADPAAEPDEYVEQRLLGIREMSNQAIGSIDDLLQHTA
ncbi:hypothetical protein ACFPOI_24110 [Nonomuraea angiospora]|uniref:Uncharacterized protein n=1 Tax=Nonomuraea angiospora TaxID=46172 RepID=A0ABR9MLD1_9ACTN|nr:hypothetical protein [Nonomuraea angiospora]MBE1593762.1 hypothetical protein [Nonomuraea angiospora]MDX3105312.1 hypothetical protein [Nonomuraea angiospora]